MATGPQYQCWHHRAEDEDLIWVYPDGCRDVLIVREPGAPARVLLTDFDHRPRPVRLPIGTQTTGYRLRPGTMASGRELAVIAADIARAPDILSAIPPADDLDDVIAGLTRPGATLAAVSRAHGVSPRTMQRRFREMRLPPPDYWRLLARARRAAALLSDTMALADLAGDCGFSDQAHMTRDIVRWFGVTPARLRRNASLCLVLAQPALGNWTGEQISTR